MNMYLSEIGTVKVECIEHTGDVLYQDEYQAVLAL